MKEHPLYPKFEEWHRSADNRVSRLAFKDELWIVFLAGIEAQRQYEYMKVQEQSNFFKSGLIESK